MVAHDPNDSFVHVRGASEHNLKTIDVDLPRDAMVAFTGVSGSGKSSLAFGTLYAEAQRRYFESVAPYARRLLQQVGAPHVQEITGLPPAVALQQRRGAPTSRSSVGTLTTLSNLVRMLYSRAGTYPDGAARLGAEAFSPNTAAGACPRCQGLGEEHDVSEDLLVPDTSLSIREGAIAAWPGAWQGANLRSIVAGLGIDVDAPWRSLTPEDRTWLLFTDEQPKVLIKPERDRIDYGYYGLFWSARAHVHHVLATSKSQMMRDKAMRFVRTAECSVCRGTGLQPDSLTVTFRGLDIAEVNALSFTELVTLLRPVAELTEAGAATSSAASGEATEVAVRLCADLVARVEVLLRLGLGYLSLGRSSTTLSPGRRSACGSPPSCARASSGSSTCSTSRPRACTLQTPRRCSTCSSRSRARGTRCSSWSTTSTSCGGPTGSSTSVQVPESTVGRCSTPGRSRGSSTLRGRSRDSISSVVQSLSNGPCARLTAGCTCTGSAGTTSTTSRSTCRCAC